MTALDHHAPLVSTLAEESPETLLERSAAGDERAFVALHDQMRPRIERVARRVIRDWNLAEEVTQEVLSEAWTKADRFDRTKGSASAWITTMTHRRAVDRVRSEQAARTRADKAARRDQVRSFDVVADEVETRLEHWQVRQALQALTERQREAVELAYFGGHTYRDVARVLEIPEGTAKSRLRDGLGRLRTRLEALLEIDGVPA